MLTIIYKLKINFLWFLSDLREFYELLLAKNINFLFQTFILYSKESFTCIYLYMSPRRLNTIVTTHDNILI